MNERACVAQRGWRKLKDKSCENVSKVEKLADFGLPDHTYLGKRQQEGQ